jgi:ubiquitin carboxyl-terminal hydrolase 7
MLFHVNDFRRKIYALPHLDESFRTSTTLALQSIFKNLQTSDKEVTTKELTVAFGWTSAEAFQQQDVQEMMRVLLEKLEDKMKGTQADGYIKALFAGSIRSFIKCVDVDYESKREEDFYDIQVI